MLRKFIPVLLLSLGLAVVAQQNPSVKVGEMRTHNGVNLVVTGDSKGTIILATPDHCLYLDGPFATRFGETLASIQKGMQELEIKDINVVDYQQIKQLNFDGSREWSKDGLVFRFEFNQTKGDKVLLLMHSTTAWGDMLFSSTELSQLGDLVSKAKASIAEYTEQYGYIQSIVDKINATGIN